MQKINFVDLPSTTTPLNATNMNAIQSNVEDVFNGTVPAGNMVVAGITSTTGVDKYSTNEIRVGTWIDNKPLYRRVFQIPTTTISSSSATAISISVGNVNVVDVRGYVYVGTSKYRYSINGMRTFDYGWRYDEVNHGMQLIVATSLAPEGTINGVAIVEYTKSSD